MLPDTLLGYGVLGQQAPYDVGQLAGPNGLAGCNHLAAGPVEVSDAVDFAQGVADVPLVRFGFDFEDRIHALGCHVAFVVGGLEDERGMVPVVDDDVDLVADSPAAVEDEPFRDGVPAREEGFEE